MRDDDLNSRQRVWFLDEARGLSILLMVLHHGAYDAAFLLGWPLDFLSAGWFGIIRTFFVGVFVLISGCACRFSRSNLRRGARCLLLAAGLSAITAFLIPAQRIRFGILHLLGCAMLLFAFLQPLLDRIPPLSAPVWACFFFSFVFRSPADGWASVPCKYSFPAVCFKTPLPRRWDFPGRAIIPPTTSR